MQLLSTFTETLHFINSSYQLSWIIRAVCVTETLIHFILQRFGLKHIKRKQERRKSL